MTMQQVTMSEYLKTRYGFFPSCDHCVCRKCLFWWSDRCPVGECMNTDLDIQRKCDVGLFGAADWLVERGWVLLHNPGMGIATPTKNPAREFTKAQKEFLYDYYMERNRENEANAIWEE